MECKVSIIVPVYNVESYIERCIRSIQEQTLTEFECLIIDDASPDNSITRIQPIIKNDKRFRVIHHTKNKGPGPARNTGIEHARAEYVCFVDSDDFIEYNFLEVLYKTVIDNNADMANCAYYEINGSVRKKIIRYASAHTFQDAIRNILIGKDTGGPCFCIYKKNLFQNIQFPLGEYSEDIGAIFKLIMENKISFIPYVQIPLYNYFQNPNSLTHRITMRQIYYLFRNKLIPITNGTYQHSKLMTIQADIPKFLFIILSMGLLSIQRFSQNFIIDLLFLKKMIRKYIPMQLLYRIHFKITFDKEIIGVYGWKRIIIYNLMYISHLKFGIFSFIFAIAFHKIFRVFTTVLLLTKLD